MNILFRKPILILGIGLSLTFGIGDIFQHSFPSADYTPFLAIALGGFFWFLQQKKTPPLIPLNNSPVEQKMVEEAIAKTEILLKLIEKEAPETNIENIKQELTRIPQIQARNNLNIGIMGEKRVGKTCLSQLLSQQNKQENITYLDSQEIPLNADLVIFVINGDLTASEAQIIGNLRASKQRVVLTLNKQDQYNREERSEILLKIGSTLTEIISKEDIISISAAPTSLKVKKYQADGTILEEIQTQLPEINALHERLNDIIKTEKKQLILATTWRKVKLLEKQAKNCLNQIRNNRSQPIIDQYQWLAATTALANPVASLDLLATAAINGQMLVDLASIYQQKISLDQAQNAAVTIGKVMVKLGIVEISTQAIASLLKSNTVTYIAGGILQGISAAYLTRIAGLSLIAYYEEQEISQQTSKKLNLDQLTSKIKTIFSENQKTNLLKNLVIQQLAINN